MDRPRGQGLPARRAAARRLRAVRDRRQGRQELDDPPRAAPAARQPAADARHDRQAARPRPARVGGGDEVGRRPRDRVHRERPAPARLADGQGHHRHLPGTGRDGPRDRAQAGADRRRDRRLQRRPARLRGAAAADARLVGRAGRPAGAAHPRHVSRVRRAATGRAVAHRAPLLRAACAAQFLFPEREQLALPAQFPRRGPGRRAHRLRGERPGRRGGEAARLQVRAGRQDRQLAEGQEPAPPGGRRGGLEAGQGQQDRADRLAARRRAGRAGTWCTAGTWAPGSPTPRCAC